MGVLTNCPCMFSLQATKSVDVDVGSETEVGTPHFPAVALVD